jgi:osmotically-inducible protein OsmY
MTGSYAHGMKQRATHVREVPKDYDDVTLTRRIETEIFRPADAPKGQINVNVQNGLVQLRGEVPRTDMIRDLEEQVRRIQGVREVENLLHLPDTEPQMHQ